MISQKDFVTKIFTTGIQTGGIIAYVSFTLYFLKKLKEFFGNPLQVDFLGCGRTHLVQSINGNRASTGTGTIKDVIFY